MMIFQGDVFGLWLNLRDIDKINTAFVILEDGAVDSWYIAGE